MDAVCIPETSVNFKDYKAQHPRRQLSSYLLPNMWFDVLQILISYNMSVKYKLAFLFNFQNIHVILGMFATLWSAH
jgi:hypothetical protein